MRIPSPNSMIPPYSQGSKRSNGIKKKIKSKGDLIPNSKV
jgi:hypothetical protein